MKQPNKQKSLAFEVCEELKATACKWRTAFFITVGIEVLTIAGFLFLK